ncbi:MAG: GAF domain-containing sensor histidine kinase [Roseiflexaceae bacterium]|nr:GAF domain-containing sensor histidine kinase [Roseiflexaceae bacterium]
MVRQQHYSITHSGHLSRAIRNLGDHLAATQHAAPTTPVENHLKPLAGESFYIVVRWMVIALLLVISPLITGESIFFSWEISHPGTLLIVCYALFNLVATVALALKPLAFVNRAAFVIDIFTITLLTYFDQSGTDLFYPLYFFPLIGAGMQVSARRGLLLGCLAAAGYISAFASLRLAIDTGLTSNPLLIVAVVLRCITLILIPWLTGGLAGRSGTVNRQRVAEAQQETQRATFQANTYREQTKALYDVATTLSATMNYQSVLDVMLIECRKLVPYNSALALLSTGEPDELYVAAAAGLSEAEKSLRPMISAGPVGEALRTGDPAIVSDPARQPELQPFASLRTSRSVCVVPLRASLKSYGMLVIAGNAQDVFGHEQLGKVTALANYAIIALHNAQLVHDLRQERSKLISKEEEVRHQLARDLHDGPAQALAAIAMNVEFIKRLLERDPSRVEGELDKLIAMAKRTAHEVRTMLFELRPLVLETQGLDTTLRQYFERFQGNATEIILESEPITAELDTKTEGTLFNIVQESVNNALKHAQATHIWVRLKQHATTLETVVQDDGRGFDLKRVMASYEQRGSFGLLNIDERAKLIGGTAELQSTLGQGTVVKVIIPLH